MHIYANWPQKEKSKRSSPPAVLGGEGIAKKILNLKPKLFRGKQNYK